MRVNGVRPRSEVPESDFDHVPNLSPDRGSHDGQVHLVLSSSLLYCETGVCVLPVHCFAVHAAYAVRPFLEILSRIPERVLKAINNFAQFFVVTSSNQG